MNQHDNSGIDLTPSQQGTLSNGIQQRLSAMCNECGERDGNSACLCYSSRLPSSSER